jgi:serine/threonine-protein kinase
MALSVGTHIGPYEIMAPIGAGGMGEVYRAHDSRLNRDVAIKTLPAALADDANRMARLQREAQVLASLSHPNIAPIFGLEEAGGIRALVMELVEGPTLAERIAAGPIPLEEALVLARQIADALEAAHEKGIVHRDLKPANIKLTTDNKIKVLDFGLAKAFEGEAASGGNLTNSPTLTLEATRAGMIMGTAGYMSPEQARGKPVDKRADIWAFGVVLFEMLTGRSTFEGETVSDTLAAVLRADIDWKQLPAGTPPKVRRLLQRCLERDARKRLRDIGDAWIEIDSPDELAVAAPVQPRQKGMWWLGWAAAVVIAGVGVAWALLHRPSAEPRAVVRWTYSQKALFGIPVLSHDGTRLDFSELAGTTPHLVLRMMDQVEAKPLPGADNMYFGDFSPDGQWIVAFMGTAEVKLKKIPVTGGTAITLADVASPSGVSWGDDGTIVFSGGKGLMRISSAGGTPVTLTTPDSKKGETSHVAPHFLPGARVVLFTIKSGTTSQIAVLDLKKGGYRVVASNGQDGRYVPTGHLVYIRGATLFAVPFDTEKLAATGSEAPVVEGISTNGPSSSIAEYTFSDSGSLVYIEATTGGVGGTTMGWADRQGQQQQAISETVLWGTGRLSPDGRRIANGVYTSATTAGSPQDIWVFDTERKIKTRVTFGGVNADPIWTPDGRRITYSALLDGKRGIYWVQADGSGKPEQLLATDSEATPSSWSPDGKFLLYSQSVDKKPPRIWVLPVAGGVAGKPYPLHDAEAYETGAQVSPDGRWVAYVSQETGQTEIYVQPFPGPGGKERVSTQGGDSVRWARSGRELFYRVLTGESGVMAVDFQAGPHLQLGLPKVLIKGTFGTTFDVAPDGKRFLVELIGGADTGGRRMVGVDNWFEELKRRVPVKR